MRRRKQDAESNQEIEADTDDEEHNDEPDLDLIKDFVWFKVINTPCT